jgi:hypothetical protein
MKEEIEELEEKETRNAGAEKVEVLLPLFDERIEQELRSRWNDIQARFVDNPRTAVEEADNLVAEVMERISRVYADEREKLENRTAGEDISTEDLRVALQRYRSFFNRLLAL